MKRNVRVTTRNYERRGSNEKHTEPQRKEVLYGPLVKGLKNGRVCPEI